MPLATNTKLGRYEIRSHIGAGGMGEVYLAWDTELGRTVALKILPASIVSEQQRMHRFIQEARAASALNHPNIITIYEVGQAEGTRFIATEFIRGVTLRERMTGAPMRVSEVLDVATQVASALTAAHAAGIVHRDVKPENVMLRDDGFVKVLDFGLAKLTARHDSNSEAPTLVETSPGMVLGTITYMSPEQARGAEVDPRTDIWSFGVVLYEMIAGRVPFQGVTAGEVFASILGDEEPTPLARYARQVPVELERIVTKALRKDREERYQTSKDLLIDLKNLKRQQEVEAEIKRTGASQSGSGGAPIIDNGQPPVEMPRQSGAGTGGGASIRGSGAEYLIREIESRKWAAVIGLGVILIAAAAALTYRNRAPALTEKDTILLADFVNTTGDQVFNGTLKQALAVQLEQSPYLNIFSDQRIADALRYMNRSPDERVTRSVAREICQRHGIKAMLLGSISSHGRNYVITLEAVNAQTGDVIARQQAEAEAKEQVLRTLGQAASKLRGQLGESLSTIQKFDAPIEQVTTSSLEALRAYSVASEHRIKGAYHESVTFFKRAIELDPNFAIAYARLGAVYFTLRQSEVGSEYMGKAFELRERVSEREKLYISSLYYYVVSGEMDRCIEVLELYKQTYPRDFIPFNNLSAVYYSLGQHEKIIEEAREAIRLYPNGSSYANIAAAFILSNQFDEAKKVIEQALAQKLDAPTMRRSLYVIALIEGDRAALQNQLAWASGKPIEHEAFGVWQAGAAALSGQLGRARELAQRGVELAKMHGVQESAALYAAEQGVREALAGDCQRARESVTAALDIARVRPALLSGAHALALCGEVGKAQILATEVARQFPKHTLLHSTWLPVIQATVALHQDDPEQALHSLRAAGVFVQENVSVSYDGFAVTYLRGSAHLRARRGAEAIGEFQKILDHRGADPLSIFYPLTQLGLARGAALAGDMAQSRKAYQDFFALWKDADPDVPILLEAKREYEKLK